jgi:hypothetical protein
MGRYRLSVSPPTAACQQGVVRRACDEGASAFNIEYVHSSYVDALLRHVHAEGSGPKLGFWDENPEIDL